MRIQPAGGVQDPGDATMASAAVAVPVIVGSAEAVGVSVSGKLMVVAVGVGKLCGNVGGICVGVAGGGRVSARDKKMPPITRITEKIATITPPPS
jgi:hypothetical protein